MNEPVEWGKIKIQFVVIRCITFDCFRKKVQENCVWEIVSQRTQKGSFPLNVISCFLAYIFMCYLQVVTLSHITEDGIVHIAF